MTVSGHLFGLGVGPGDPELITVKALRQLQQCSVVAYFAGRGRKGHAYTSIEMHLQPQQTLLRLEYPLTTEAVSSPAEYETTIRDFYDCAAATLAEHLQAGRDVAVVCEGDPMLYGSYMYLHDRLADRYPSHVVPGVCAMLAGAAMLGTPLVYRDQSLSVLAGTLSEAELSQRIGTSEAVVIMKLGRQLDKVRRVLSHLGRLEQALYIERATMPAQRICSLASVDAGSAPYFAMIVVPGRRWQA